MTKRLLYSLLPATLQHTDSRTNPVPCGTQPGDGTPQTSEYTLWQPLRFHLEGQVRLRIESLGYAVDLRE
jgi:hypothetical protein